MGQRVFNLKVALDNQSYHDSVWSNNMKLNACWLTFKEPITAAADIFVLFSIENKSTFHVNVCHSLALKWHAVLFS